MTDDGRATNRPTRRLADLLRPTGPDLQAVPEGDAGWERLLAVADRHRLVPALASAGLASGWLRPVPAGARAAIGERTGPLGPPPEVRLLEALDRNRDRIDSMLAQGLDVLEALDRAGVPAAPLKGLDALLRRRYPDPAARTMTDLDVLVPAGAAEAALAALAGAGFAPVDAPGAEHHLAPLARPGAPGSVEIHTGVLRGRWAAGLSADGLLDRSERAPAGEPGRRLTATDAATVLVAHAQLQDEARVLLQLPLRALHETALLLAGPGEAQVDWAMVAERTAAIGPGAGAALDEHLWLAAALFGSVPPLRIGEAARRHGRLVLAVADHPRLRAALGQLAFLPRSFSAERMVALHGGAPSGAGLWRTRARHAARGLRRRAGGGSTTRP